MGGAERLYRVVDENIPTPVSYDTASERNSSLWSEQGGTKFTKLLGL